ncbi:MAG: ABC transporter permease [Acidiferrobacteraceae bacterium]
MAIQAHKNFAQTIRAGSLAWWRYRDLLRNLVQKDIKVRYMGASMGFAWSLMNPLSTMLMYLFVFGYVFKSALPNYSLYLICAILHWTFFSSVIMQSPEILVSNSGLIKKINFPRLLVTLSNLMLNLVLWFMALAVFLLMYPWLGGRWSWVLLLYPAYLLLFLAFTWGWSLILCVLYVDYRDIKHLVEVMIQLLFWTAPIAYSFTQIPAKLRPFFAINPLTEFTLIFHDIFWSNTVPTIRLTGAFTVWAVASLVLGLTLFRRMVPSLVERL